MTIEDQAIITLIRSGIINKKCILPANFDLACCMEQLRRHQIRALAYQGAVCCGLPKNTPAMQSLFRDYVQALMQSERQMRAVQRLCTAFEEYGIDYLPLKGCKLKKLYPNPELRSMGDADILIRREQYDRILTILQEQGYEEEVGAEHTCNWKSPELYLELHLSLVPNESQTSDLYSYVGDPWKRAVRMEGHCYAMRPEDEYLFLFIHFVKHYRMSGIGCRHLTDLWVYRRANPQMDEDYLQAELNKMNLLVFHKNLIRTAESWFEDGPADEVTQLITARILESGCWGIFSSWVLAEGARRNAIDRKNHGSLYTAFLIAFPRAKDLEKVYPILRKCPFLLPVFWLVRAVDVLRLRRRNIALRKLELKLVTPENVAAYEADMQKVGLHYSFGEIAGEDT